MPDDERAARIELILAGKWREYLEQIPDWDDRLLESLKPGKVPR